MNLKHFTLDEFDCQHTGENKMDPSFLARLDELRDRCGFPFHITSGYRSVNHPIEAAKARPGKHTRGYAADIRVESGVERRRIVSEALKMGFGGIGVSSDFVHVDDRPGLEVLWGYD